MSSSSPPQTPTSTQLDKPSLLAAARLKHHITDLQTRVSASAPPPPPPRRTIFHLIPDSTALSSPAISDLRSLVQSRRLTLTIPYCALAELDRLKKGSEDQNVNARAAIRWFDKGGPGLRVQQPQETVAADDPVVGCALFLAADAADMVICTDDEERAETARAAGVRCVGSWEIEGLVVREEVEFNERKRAWEVRQRGGGGAGRGARGSPGRGAKIVIDPEEFGRGGRRMGGGGGGGGWNAGGRGGGGDYVLRGPQRGVQRGRGKLWEP